MIDAAVEKEFVAALQREEAERQNFVAVSRSMIDAAVEKQFVASLQREERQRTAAEAEGVVDELIANVTDQLIRQCVERVKQQVCMEEGLPPAVLEELLKDYHAL